MRAAVGVRLVAGLVLGGLVLGGCAAHHNAAPARVAPSTTTTTTVATVEQVAKTVAPVPPPCGGAAVACVRLSTGQAWLRPPGQPVVGPVGIGFGVGAYATPVGVFHVAWKAEHWVSREYHEPMPDAVFFAAGGIAFHAGSLGNSSHGCVHLAPSVAAQFFSVLHDGDEVQVLS